MSNKITWDEDLTQIGPGAVLAHQDEGRCLFCEAANGESDILRRKDHYYTAACFFDNFPVTRYHMLIVPTRHVEDYFHLTKEEKDHIDHLITRYSYQMMKRDHTITGFNIGWNCGADAGQTILHAHCHLIPRRAGDMEKPEGGIRHCVIGKGYYR